MTLAEIVEALRHGTTEPHDDVPDDDGRPIREDEAWTWSDWVSAFGDD